MQRIRHQDPQWSEGPRFFGKTFVMGRGSDKIGLAMILKVINLRAYQNLTQGG